jgi:hypothetical protein
MREILEAVAAEALEHGVNVSQHVGAFPADDGDSVYVVVPHEYFVLTPQDEHPARDQLKRTIAFCVEHPGNATFEVGSQWAARVGAAMDINRDSCEELNRRGVPAHRFVLGYSSRWDRWRGDPSHRRDIDVTYLGTTDARRDYLLALQSEVFSQWRTSFLIPPHEQMTRARPDFLIGCAKYEHLSNSRTLINLHRGASRSLEWVRVLEAMCNGCVVVSEWSTDFDPLIPGEHFILTSAGAVAEAATALLRTPQRLDGIRDAAYALCQTKLPMSASVALLIEQAEDLMTNRARAHSVSREVAVRPNPTLSMNEPSQPDDGYPVLADWAQTLPPNTRMAVAASVAGYVSSLDFAVSSALIGEASQGTLVDVLVIANGNPADLSLTMRSLSAQDVPLKVHLASVEIASRELGHPRGRMINALTGQAESDAIVIADAGLSFMPTAIHKLRAALEGDPLTSAVYPMVADTQGGFLWNSLPAEKERLERRNYLGTPIMLRREALQAIGGYVEDARLIGFEDLELYLRLLDRGYGVKLVPEILAQGSRPVPPAVSVSGLRPELAVAILRRNFSSRA